ncbi:MAG: hypothetical protein PHQ66_01645 [Candidatus Nanoarchaeia archaeon]|nr:hypothetical protein [Candidatus Nanoarchaeia archaeon]MDD5357921.1 hypothetical protein [Candidatus Nanoarchaeia archaeon]MDD5588840.1 hypothetical protein [Candidatus Nanoarchaeia archaeon]
MTEDVVLILSLSLSAVFISVIFNLLSIGIEFVGWRTKKIIYGNFTRLTFFTLSWSVVASLYYIGHKEIHFAERFLSDTYYLNIVIVIGVVIMWAVDLIYFRGKIESKGYKLYIAAGGFAILFLIEKIVSYFIHNFYLELIKGLTLTVPSMIVFFIVINSMIKNKKNG